MSTGEKLGMTILAQIAFLAAGLIIIVAWTRGNPQPSHLWYLLGASSLPWVILFLNAVKTTAPIEPEFTRRHELTRDDFRLIPVYRHNILKYMAIDVEDWKYFITVICETRDWTQRAWRNVVMPSGVLCDDQMHRKMCTVLEKAGFLVGRKPRHRGRLVVTRPETIMATLGLLEARKEY